MSESLLVGDSQQLDYTRTIEKISAHERQKLYGASVTSSNAAGNSIPQPIGSSQAFNALGVSPNDVKGKQPQDEEEPIYYDETTEGRP